MNLSEIKKFIEDNTVAFATITNNNKPNVVIVDGIKVVSDDQVLICDNCMYQTIMDITNNNTVCLVVWNKDLQRYKLLGNAEYFTEGKWRKCADEILEKSGLIAKGAMVVTVEKIIPSV